MEDGGDGQLLLSGIILAERDLVRNRPVGLQVAGIAGIECRSFSWSFSWRRS